MIDKISKMAEKLNIPEEYLEYYGDYKAKISNNYYNELEKNKSGKLILFTAINPTPQGEGKTTQSIGLTMAINKLGKKSIAVLREPSLGPVFGTKGGAVGGGMAKVIPSDDIDLHFTGDFHAITSANNLLCAVIDNHIFQGNELKINPDTIQIKRSMDMNDRALRNVVIGSGRKTGFEITSACEVMAICCLSNNKEELKVNLGNILVGYNDKKEPIYAKDLNVVGAMMSLLRDVLNPNLVQTTENTPCIIHLGPFANIAHGCNSNIATKMGLKLADYCITEAGFGADMGAEKFLDIKARKANISPDLVVLVATVKALKYNGYDLNGGTDALKKGIVNLERHIENIKKFNLNLIVCINKFEDDTDEEINVIKEVCNKYNVKVEVSTAYKDGADGAIQLAKVVLNELETESQKLKYIYNDADKIAIKIEKVCKEIYRAKEIKYSVEALNKLENITKLGYDNLPICIAKTPVSFSDDPKLLGAPNDFTMTIGDIKINSGAGFIVVYAGDIMTMPGLGKNSKYLKFEN